MIPRRILWWVPALLALHDAEEALAMPRVLPRLLPALRAYAPHALSPLLAGMTVPIFLSALAVVTLVPFMLALRASRHPKARWAHWSLALVQAVVALNVVSHLVSAAMLRGYTPGLATAISVNLPFSLFFFRRAWRDAWFSRGALCSMVPAALILHGPGLLGLFALAQLVM
ncbi:MAG TPA: HXXEE domain-containing protein [Gemmatimonadaceae bacterium]|nr:HXXEE domain-containing protein [Gemmatimonadaceae bacterium]